MKKLLFLLFLLLSLFSYAATLSLSPRLSAPLGGDGAIVEAAVLVSTNDSATASVSAVYELPVYSPVQHVTVVTNDILTVVTNAVVKREWSYNVTSNYTVDVVYGVATTNYWNITTNNVVAYVARPGPVVTTTNTTLEVTSTMSVTNALLSLTAASGFAETNDVGRCLAPGARLLLTGEPLTIFLR